MVSLTFIGGSQTSDGEIIMEVIRDMIGGSKPDAIDIFYNGTLDADSVTLRYAGSLVKLMDIDDVDNGWFFTWAGNATAMENVVGILEEEQPITGNELPDTGTNGMTLRKMTPIFPSTIIRAEYVQADRAGTAMYDTGATASAASTALTAADTTTGSKIHANVTIVNFFKLFTSLVPI